MKAKLLCLFALVALAACSQKGQDFEGMTAGEEVRWMHGWMERAYGQEPEDGFDYELYYEQAPLVKDHVYGITRGYEQPVGPADLMKYFAGVPDEMISYDWAWDDKPEKERQVKGFWESIRMLQDYASGKSDTFPAEKVLSEVNCLLDRYHDIKSHSGCESAIEYSYLLLSYRIIQQLVRLCPDIDMIASVKLGDAAVISFEGGSFNPETSVLLLNDKGSRFIPAMVERNLVDIKPGKMEEDVYHFYAYESYESRRVLSLHKVGTRWTQWYRNDGEWGFLPGGAYYIPESLEQHMRKLMNDHTVALPYKVQDDSVRFYSELRALDSYARGERKFYPDKEFRDAFESLAFANDWEDNHGGGEDSERMCALACLMEFGAYHAQDINFLTDFVSADHNVGVFEYPAATDRCFNLYVTFKEHGVFRVRTLNTDYWGSPCGYEGPNHLTHVRKIGDEDARMYLFSNEYTYWFSQCLCWYDDDGDAHFFVPESLDECVREWITEEVRSMDERDLTIVYNPGNVCWNICTKVGNVYQPLEGTRTLYLELDGLDSRYRVE